MKLPKIDRILSADGGLQPLVAKARTLSALAGLAGGYLPPDLARQVRVANFRDGELVLLASNPSAASKLKLLGPSLCRFLTTEGWQVNLVSVRVQPASASPEDAVDRPENPELSKANVDSLRALHARMADSPARAALAALIARAEGRPDPGGRTKGRAAARRTGGAG